MCGWCAQTRNADGFVRDILVEEVVVKRVGPARTIAPIEHVPPAHKRVKTANLERERWRRGRPGARARRCFT
ncbi:hypothetical protein CCO02nite_27940 [Cellulomonas composti]|uniref:Uncharacterized protein n=1 Tax=Cellulomonas composti TaxID=266130 RepID=A0A511JDW8_9CELL|nr:hypothetical protein CCO02nite_27940 [Cellulomonas composti]